MATQRKNYDDIPEKRDALIVAMAEEIIRLHPTASAKLAALLARFKTYEVDKRDANRRRRLLQG
jgi:hypothetical protein